MRAQAEREHAIVLAMRPGAASAAPDSGADGGAPRAGAPGRRASSLSLAQLAAAQGGSRLARRARRGAAARSEAIGVAAAGAAVAAARADSAEAGPPPAATEKKLDKALTAVGGWLNRLAGHDASSPSAAAEAEAAAVRAACAAEERRLAALPKRYTFFELATEFPTASVVYEAQEDLSMLIAAAESREFSFYLPLFFTRIMLTI